MFYLTMPKYEDMISQSNVHVGTQCFFKGLIFLVYVNIPII